MQRGRRTTAKHCNHSFCLMPLPLLSLFSELWLQHRLSKVHSMGGVSRQAAHRSCPAPHLHVQD